jgi:hypothetical protein
MWWAASGSNKDKVQAAILGVLIGTRQVSSAAAHFTLQPGSQ